MTERRVECTNRIAPEPVNFREPRKSSTTRYHGDTLRIHTGGKKLQIKQGWPEKTQPIENLTGMPPTQKPMNVCCIYCNNNITTELQYISGGMTWIVSWIVASFGGIFGCCLLPFYMRTCKDVLHSCPKCNAYLAVYYRI